MGVVKLEVWKRGGGGCGCAEFRWGESSVAPGLDNAKPGKRDIKAGAETAAAGACRRNTVRAAVSRAGSGRSLAAEVT